MKNEEIYVQFTVTNHGEWIYCQARVLVLMVIVNSKFTVKKGPELTLYRQTKVVVKSLATENSEKLSKRISKRLSERHSKGFSEYFHIN